MYGQKSISQSLLDAVNAAMFEDIHPQAQSLLKHIKPEHHATYKPFLAKGTFNGSYKDRTDVLSAAKKAGHLVSESQNIEEIEEGFKELMKAAKDAAGPQPNGGSGIKLGTRYGGGRQKDDEREKETERLDNKKKMKKEDMEFKDRLIESLKGNQKKIDKNHNNKIDAQDFKILRAQKEEVELDEAEKSKSLTVDTLAGPKKAPKGFEKDNEHVSAKVPLKTEEMEHDDEKEDKALLKKMVKKSALKNEETLEERDEGKPGLMFKKIAAKASKEYGSKEAGNRVAGAIRKKVLAKEDTVEEGVGSTLKKFAKKVGDTLGHGSDEDLKKDLQRKMGIPQTGKPSMAKQNEAKRPESDDVPFITNEPQSPKERLRSALGKVKTEMKKSWK